METKTFTVGKYTATAQKRVNINSYFNCPYQVIIKQSTPKAKYFSEKILKNFVFDTEEKAIKYVTDYIDRIATNLNSRKNEIEKRRNENKNVKASDFYKVGDIVVNSWGFEQTNIEFYKVTDVKNKTITVKEINQVIEEGSEYSHGMACNVLPGDKFLEKGDTYDLRVKAGGCLSNPQSFYYMHKWSGRSEYKSWYA